MKLKNVLTYPVLTALVSAAFTLTPGPAPRAADDDIEYRVMANSGPLAGPVSSSQPNSNTPECLRASNGWHRFVFPRDFRYNTWTNVIFEGPNTPNTRFVVTNSHNLSWLTITTCTNVNGTVLRTGIKLKNDDSNLVVACVTNDASCSVSSNLSTLKFRMTNNSYYRAMVYYNTNTLGSLTNILLHYKYTTN